MSGNESSTANCRPCSMASCRQPNASCWRAVSRAMSICGRAGGAMRDRRRDARPNVALRSAVRCRCVRARCIAAEPLAPRGSGGRAVRSNPWPTRCGALVAAALRPLAHGCASVAARRACVGCAQQPPEPALVAAGPDPAAARRAAPASRARPAHSAAPIEPDSYVVPASHPSHADRAAAPNSPTTSSRTASTRRR